MRCPMVKINRAQPVRAMMYFFPSVEFQIRENRFMKSASRRTREIYRRRWQGVNEGWQVLTFGRQAIAGTNHGQIDRMIGARAAMPACSSSPMGSNRSEIF